MQNWRRHTTTSAHLESPWTKQLAIAQEVRWHLNFNRNTAYICLALWGVACPGTYRFHRTGANADRVRHPLDPLSMLDRGATWGPFTNQPTHLH